MSDIHYKAEQIFGTLTNSGEWLRGKCPECGNSDKSVSIHAETGNYFCWHESCGSKGSVVGPIQPVEFNGDIEPLKFKKDDFKPYRETFVQHFKGIIDKYDLPWDEASCLNEDLGIGWNKKHKRLVFKISDFHIKEHKGPQFGSDKSCKIFPLSVIKKANPKQILFIVEGEKDAITLSSHNISAITFTSGAGSVPSKITDLDAFKNIVVCYDNDEVGERGALNLAKRLANDQERRIRIYKWKERPNSFDVTDHFRSGGDRESFINRLLDAQEFGGKSSDFGGLATYSIDKFISKAMVPTEYICNEILLKGGLCALAGTSNVGKSIMAMQFGMCVAMGIDFMNFSVSRPHNVFYAQFEMTNDMIKGRLERLIKALCYKYPEKRKLLSSNFALNFIERDTRVFVDKWDQLRGNMMAAMRHKPFDVLIVDNLYTSTSKNIIKNNEFTQLLSKIKALQLEFDLSIMLINHHNKLQGDNKTLNQDQIRGGKVFTDFVDNVVQVAMSPRKDKLRILKVTKVRTESDFHNVPCAIKLNDENGLAFEWIGPVKGREELWYEEGSVNYNDDIHDQCLSYMDDEDLITTNQFAAILEEISGYTSPTTLHRTLNKFCNHGRLIKTGRGKYKVVNFDLPEV